MLAGGHGDVYLEIRPSHKRLCRVSFAAQGFADLLHHYAGARLPGGAWRHRQSACLRIFEECLQAFHSLGAGALQVYLAGFQGGEYHHLIACTRHGHVQPPFTAGIVQGAEVHRYLPVLVCAVADGEEYHVALVTLHVLQVLDEYRLLAVHGRLLELRVPVERLGQVIFYQVALHLAEGDDADAVLLQLLILQPAQDLIDDGLRLAGVAPGASFVVDAVDGHQRHPGHTVVGRGECEQAVAVILRIAERDQALVLAAIVPGELMLAQGEGDAVVEDALHVVDVGLFLVH